MQPRSDTTTIRDRVLGQLQANPAIDPGRLEIAVAPDGIVAVGGVVRTYAEKCLVEELVGRVRGVRGVKCRIDVRLTIGDYRTDATLERVIGEVLDSLARMPPERPHVAVTDGWVTLTGRVQTATQKQLVDRVIREVAGVRGITNRLVVERPTRSRT